MGGLANGELRTGAVEGNPLPPNIGLDPNMGAFVGGVATGVDMAGLTGSAAGGAGAEKDAGADPEEGAEPKTGAEDVDAAGLVVGCPNRPNDGFAGSAASSGAGADLLSVVEGNAVGAGGGLEVGLVVSSCLISTFVGSAGVGVESSGVGDGGAGEGLADGGRGTSVGSTGGSPSILIPSATIVGIDAAGDAGSTGFVSTASSCD